MKQSLWTRDFTILTLGSVISMMGNTAAGAGMSLLVLDYTGSTLFYALYLFVYTAPAVIMPLLAGPYLDKFSRRKVIYTLDFISTALYFILALSLYYGWFNFPMLLASSMLIGSIQSIYQVAYASFYPMLITEGNYTKAYSVSSTIETMSIFIYPVAVVIYNTFGIVPLFLANTVTFLVAAIGETTIRAQEHYTVKREEHVTVRSYFVSLKEGFHYLKAERGLLFISLYFMFSYFSYGTTNVVTLPYFRSTFNKGEYIYTIVTGMNTLGRTIGGFYYYGHRYPKHLKYRIALCVYLMISTLDCCYLFLPVPLMMLCCLMTGLGGMTSYNIRLSSTQSYVPDDRKGRYNGIFQMMTTVGTLVGQLIGGVLSTMMGERAIVVIISIITGSAAFLLIGKHKPEVSAIYNQDI